MTSRPHRLGVFQITGCVLVVATLLGDCGAQPIGGMPRAELQGFADRLTAAVADGDLSACGECVDWSKVLDIAASSLVDDPAAAQVFKTRIKPTTLPAMSMPQSFMGVVVSQANAAGGSYQLVRLHEVDGKPRALFRMVSAAGLNYHDYELVSDGGLAVAEDVYVFLAGERLSSTLGRFLIPAIVQATGRPPQSLSAFDRAFVENASLVQQLTLLAIQGQGQAAMSVYNQLPPVMQRDKSMLLMRYRAALSIDRQAVVAAVSEYESRFPGDPGVALITMDRQILEGDFDEAMQSVEVIDRAVGGDGHLNMVRASIMISSGDNEAAVEYAEAYVEHDPSNLQSHLLLIGLVLKGNDHDRTYKVLKRASDRFENIDLQKLAGNEKYTEFFASRQGKRLLQPDGLAAQSEDSTAASEGRAGDLLSWRDRTGKFSVEAEYVGVDAKAKSVKLRRQDGKTIEVPLKRLSPESVEQAKRLYRQQKE